MAAAAAKAELSAMGRLEMPRIQGRVEGGTKERKESRIKGVEWLGCGWRLHGRLSEWLLVLMSEDEQVGSRQMG